MSQTETANEILQTGDKPHTANATTAEATAERQSQVYRGPDRRKPSLKSFIYGAFNPRRRRIRREDDRNSAFLDWYPNHLLIAATAIMCLSVADGLFTVHLINAGAVELNPLLALFVHGDATWFALIKIALTGAGVIALVIVSHARLLRKWPMVWVMYGLLSAYAWLVYYGYSLSRAIV